MLGLATKYTSACTRFVATMMPLIAAWLQAVQYLGRLKDELQEHELGIFEIGKQGAAMPCNKLRSWMHRNSSTSPAESSMPIKRLRVLSL